MRYRLREGIWYAAVFLRDDLIRSGHRYSPVRVDKITPLKTGNRLFELKFLTANYPAGVQDKIYQLQTVHAGKEYLMARRANKGSARFRLIYDIDAEWMSEHFKIELTRNKRAPDWLNREFGAR